MFRDGHQIPVAATPTCESFTGKCSMWTCRATTSRKPECIHYRDRAVTHALSPSLVWKPTFASTQSVSGAISR